MTFIIDSWRFLNQRLMGRQSAWLFLKPESWQNTACPISQNFTGNLYSDEKQYGFFWGIILWWNSSNHPYRGTLSIWKYWAYSDHYQLVNQEIHGGYHAKLLSPAFQGTTSARFTQGTRIAALITGRHGHDYPVVNGGSSEGSHGCIYSKKRGTIWSNALSFPAKLNWLILEELSQELAFHCIGFHSITS